MLLMTIKASNYESLQDLDNFLKNYADEKHLSQFSLLAADGEISLLPQQESLVPWKWYEKMQKLLDRDNNTLEMLPSVNNTDFLQSMPQNIKAEQLKQLKEILWQLITIDYEHIDLEKLDSFQINATIFEYTKNLKVSYINPLTDHYNTNINDHKELIYLANTMELSSFHALKEYSFDRHFFDTILNSIKAITAISLCLFEYYYDYFWSLIALSKAQRWMGIYIGGLSASDPNELRNKSLGAHTKALNNDRLNDCILRAAIHASRHWKKLNSTTENKNSKISKKIKNEFKNDHFKVKSHIALKALNCIKGIVEKPYDLIDIENKIDDMLNDSRSKLYQLILQYESTDNRYETSDGNPEDSENSICFHDEASLKKFIKKQIISDLNNELGSLNKTLKLISSLNDNSSAESISFENTVDDIFKLILDPLSGLKKSNPIKS